MSLYCDIRIAAITCNRKTSGESNQDEVYFILTGGSLANTRVGSIIKRAGNPDIWRIDVNQTERNIVLWQGFIENGERAIFTVKIKEQDLSGDDIIGQFKLTIIGSLPPTFLWEADSRFTSIVGPTNNASAAITARETQSDYSLTVVVDQGCTITNVNSRSKCLDVTAGSRSDNANVQQFECHGGSDQRWLPRVIRVLLPQLGTPSPPFVLSQGRGELDNGFAVFAFHAGHSGSYLDVEDAPNSRNVQQYHPHYGLNQLWFIFPTQLAAGEFFIVNAGNGHVLDVENESVDDGGNVQVFPFHGRGNQRWLIDPLPVIDSTFSEGDAVTNMKRD